MKVRLAGRPARRFVLIGVTLTLGCLMLAPVILAAPASPAAPSGNQATGEQKDAAGKTNAPGKAGTPAKQDKPAGKKPDGKPEKKNPQTDLRKLAELHKQAMEALLAKNYAKAIEKYEEILKTAAEDVQALYNLACALALSGNKAGALERLRQSVENGFVDFSHIAKDKDLDGLREEGAYKELFAKKEEYLRQARERAIRRVGEYLARSRVDSKAYRTYYDAEHRFLYFHSKSDEEFAQTRQAMEGFADGLWNTLIENRPQIPIYLVMLSQEDAPKILKGGVGGFFNQEANMLVCCERPASQLTHASIVFHEFTHGLHWADIAARRQRPPIWIMEGLSTLFESSQLENGKLVPAPSYRISIIQETAKNNGSVIPFEAFVRLDQGRFVGNANICYGQARCMMYYLYQQGLLKTFYDEYVKEENFALDATGGGALEAVFGKTLAEVEHDWVEWVLQQETTPMPFLGVVAEDAGDKVMVSFVMPKSPASGVGIRKGDELVVVDEKPLESREDLMAVVSARKVGDEIDVRVERRGEPQDFKVKLGDRPEMTSGRPPRARPAAEPREVPSAGFTVRRDGGKVVVREVAKDSSAAVAGIVAGWQIVKFNTAGVTNLPSFLAAVKKSKPGETVNLKLLDGEGKEAERKFEIGKVSFGKAESESP